MKKALILTLFVLAAGASAYGQPDRLSSAQWKLVQLDGIAVAPSSKAYVELNLDQTRFTGSTGCNRMFGSVDLQGRRVDFSSIGTTKMACVEPRVRRVETAFVKGLENVDRYRQRGNSLELYDRNRLVMKLTAAMRPGEENNDDVLNIESRKWTLEAIKGVPVSKEGRTAFVVFDKNKGSAGGNSSCNVFGGSYSATGKTIRITEIISTMRACVEDERMTIEREFLDSLRQANRYEIARGRLMLYRNDRLLLTLVGERK